VSASLLAILFSPAEHRPQLRPRSRTKARHGAYESFKGDLLPSVGGFAARSMRSQTAFLLNHLGLGAAEVSDQLVSECNGLSGRVRI
jgi:hypothetical protein